jgi:beta-lactamase regulating signal transducer with metallopeptidase domain
MIPALIEAALRAMIVALVVAVGLRLFRVCNVLAQKAAWGLVLVAALAMPIAMRWQGIPASLALRLPTPAWSHAPEPQPAPVPTPIGAPAFSRASAPETEHSGGDRFPAPLLSRSKIYSPIGNPPAQNPLDIAASTVKPPAPWATLRHFQPITLALFVYCAISAMLFLRLFYGFVTALKLWLAAEPVSLELPLNLAPDLRVRSSRAVSSPVTIGSGVVLPEDYIEWDAEKLRIVLAHERSHIRQADFYLQVLAGLYTALFWFSPLGWWLKHKLSDLGEAISDYAGLEEAASRASYAQLLLEFAALPRPTLIGVAMARTSNLPRRIERLLNDSIFRQAFAGSRRTLLAVLLVPVALFAGTALIHVEAAGQAPQPTPPTPPAQPIAPLAAVSNPDEVPVPPMPAAPGAPVTPLPPAGPGSTVIPEGAPDVPLPPEMQDTDRPVIVSSSNTTTISRDGTETTTNSGGQSTSVGHGYSYSYYSNGDSWALVTDPGDHISFSGDWNDDTRGKLDKARKLAHGKFLWFTHDGKSYFIDDPDIVTQIQAMYIPMEVLGKLQEALGKQQEELGKQQEKLGHQQELASIPTPDLSKQMAALNAAIAKLNEKAGSTVNQEELANVEAKLAEVQSELGDLQGVLGEKQGHFGEMQGKLGEQQGKLGEEQGRLGEKQGKLSQEADRKVKAIIEATVHNGKAHPVD